MNTHGTRPAQLAAMVIFAFSCFGLLLFLWLSFGGPIPLKPKGYRFQVAFPEATTLAEQADVRIAGVSVGKIVDKDLDPKSGRTLATIQLERRYAPLRSDAKAMLRQKTLLGETYVELTAGTKNAPPIAEDGRLANEAVNETVELDEVLEILPKETRRDFRRWQASSAEVIEGRGPDFNAALGGLSGFASEGADLFGVLDRRREALGSLVRETGTVFEALTRDEDALRAFIADTSRWFQATAAEKENLAESIRIFPTFLRESRSTLARLEEFAGETQPLVEDLGPVARDLQPALADLRLAAPSMQSAFRALPELTRASETGLPALSRVLRGLDPVLETTGPLLRQLNPMLQFLQANAFKVSDFIAVPGATLAGERPKINPNSLGSVLPQVIVTGSQSIIWPQRSPDNRGNAYPFGHITLDRYEEGFFIPPNWDCNNTGGEKKAQENDPGCELTEEFPFDGESLRYPHVDESDGRAP